MTTQFKITKRYATFNNEGETVQCASYAWVKSGDLTGIISQAENIFGSLDHLSIEEDNSLSESEKLLGASYKNVIFNDQTPETIKQLKETSISPKASFSKKDLKGFAVPDAWSRPAKFKEFNKDIAGDTSNYGEVFSDASIFAENTDKTINIGVNGDSVWITQAQAKELMEILQENLIEEH